MAHFDIISSQGQHPVIWSGAPKYVGAYLKPGHLEFPAIGSPAAIPWHVGDYVVYSRTGKTYRLYRTPQAVEQGLSNNYGASFLYENVQFFDDSKQLEFCPFTDLVPGDNTVHFSTQNVVSFFGKPLNVAERIQACLEAQYGAGTWAVRIVTTTDPDLLALLDTEAEFSVTGVNCLQALDKVYELWNNLGWIHTVENGKNIITIGASNVRTAANTTVPFAFDNGLVRVQRSITNADQIGTRLFAYGSMKNMDATYYRGLDIYHAESVDIEHLMIPIASWGTTGGKPDARKAFIQNAAAIASLGLIPRTAYFDGTGDLPDIHPTIERMTIGEVYDAGGAGYVPNLSKWSRDQRIDEIVSATNPIDHGTASEQGQKYAETVQGELVEDTNTHFEGEPIDTYIGTFTTTKDGKLVLKFGQNAQAIVLSSITGGIDFSDLVLEVLGSGVSKTIPIETPAYSGSNNTFTFHLPESVLIPGAEACEVSLYLNGVILTATSGHDYTQKTFTIGIDTSTPVEAKVEYEIAKTFVVRIPQIGFDIDDYADLGNGKTISMKTGMCAGRDFEVKDAAYVPSADAWDLTLYRAIDEDLNIMFPNADYEIAAADQYVLLDIAMPEMYVAVASSRLLAAAQKLIADISVEKPFYAPQIDAKVVYNEGRVLREGMWMDITQEGNREYVLIDSITIDENGSNIPTYEVALRQDKGIEWTENIGKSSCAKSSVSAKEGESASGSGTVKSVGLIVPTGMEVEGSPVTNSGTMRIVMADGYKIPQESELAQYFELDDTLVRLKGQYDYLGPNKGLVFDDYAVGATVPDSVDLCVKTVQSGNTTQRVLYSNLPLITKGDQIVGAGTPGGGGGGGRSYLHELLDVYGNPGNVKRDPSTWADPSVPEYAQAGDLLKLTNISGVGAMWTAIPQSDIIPDLTSITALIPSQASPSNQLADKAFVNSSIQTATATYQGSYNLVTDLGLTISATQAQIGTALASAISGEDNNDYAFVQIPTADATPTEIARTDRYKYNGTSWVYEYTLNNSGFTAAQWAAINSNITAMKVTSYDTIAGYFTNGLLQAAHVGDLSGTYQPLATAINTGNIGSQSVHYAYSAGYVDRTDTRNWDANSPGDYQYLWYYGQQGGVSNFPTSPNDGYYGSVVTFFSGAPSNSLHAQFAWNIAHNATTCTRGLFFRGKNDFGWDPGWHAVYTDMNANKPDVSWACSTLTASGQITGGGIHTIQYYWMNDSGGTQRTLINRAGDTPLFGYGFSIAGYACYYTGYGIHLYAGGGYSTGHLDILPNGNVGIGTNSPSYKLHVAGLIASTGDQVITSDINKKTHFQDIKVTLDQIADAPAVSFDWKKGGHSFGSIAQYWKPIVPEAVLGMEGDYSLAYSQLDAVLVINLAREVRALREEVKRLRGN